MIKALIRKAAERRHLTAEEAAQAMELMMSGEATPAQIAAFIIALRMKGETIDEITGCARVMRAKADRVDPGSADVVDTCGTGGDARNTFNISTTAAIVAAGAGVTVAKHGNRAVSSQSGSADVLKALGVNIEAPKAVTERCLREARIGFLFAPLLHGAMKHAITPRREIGVRTVFNILGPLTNPAGASCQVVGVYDDALVEPLAAVLRNLGSRHCLVVHGSDGLDEITTTGPTHVAELKDGALRTYTLRPEDVGLPIAALSDFTVASIEQAADVVREVLAGTAGPRRDIVILNAAAALYAADKAGDLRHGAALAAESIDSGAARRTLDQWIRLSRSAAE